MTCRVGILASLRVIDPLFFLWMHKFQLYLTFMRPNRHESIYSLREIFDAKSLTKSYSPLQQLNHRNNKIKHLNIPIARRKYVEVL